MSLKTPVSVLQEMCVRKHWAPQYELILDGVGSHEAHFKYKVHVGEVTAIGSGRSKKEAKHDAAKNILEVLKDGGQNLVHEQIAEEAGLVDMGDLMSPYKDKLVGNAIGELQELCMTNDITSPEYDLLAAEGPAHMKQFTIKCRVNKLEETAIDTTKKQAKQKAAHKMLMTLKSSLGLAGEKIEESKAEASQKDMSTEEIVNKYMELGSQNTSSRRVPIGQKISEYHLLLKELQSETLSKLKEGDLREQLVQDPKGLLERIAEELGITVEYFGLEALKDGKKHYKEKIAISISMSMEACDQWIEEGDQQAVMLSLSCVPEAVFTATGMYVPEEAPTKAAKQAIEYLILMTT